MNAYLISVPGKLKQLLDRIPATATTLLNRLDATISSRAPASTALLRSIWTDAKAAFLDVSISSRASATNLQTVDDNVDTILARVPGVLPTGIASVQRVVWTIDGGQDAITNVTVGAVNTSKAYVARVAPALLASAVETEFYDMAFTSSTNLQVIRRKVGAAGSQSMAFIIVEFE